jgi:hypothetical protein
MVVLTPGRTDEHCTPTLLLFSALFQAVGVGVRNGSCQLIQRPGQFSFSAVHSKLKEDGCVHQPISTLTILTKCKPDRDLSFPGGPLSWFMTSLLSLIYQTQGVKDGVWFHILSTIDFSYLFEISTTFGDGGPKPQITL